MVHAKILVGMVVCGAVASAAVSYAVGSTGFSGSALLVFIFGLASTAAICAALGSRQSPFAIAITFFLTFGLYVKFAVNEIMGREYLEPTGRFARSASEWDSAVGASVAALSGVALGLVISALVVKRRYLFTPRLRENSFYARIELPLAALSGLAALSVFAFNWKYDIVRIGIEPQLILPGPLHAIVSFSVQWGIALWAGCMAYWAWASGRLPMWAVFGIGLMQGAVAGISNLSRARYVFHAMSWLLGWLMLAERFKISITAKKAIFFSVVFVGLLGGSLVVVSLDRASSYLPIESVETIGDVSGNSAPVSDEEMSARIHVFLNQIPRLIVDRWIGMEAMMAVSSYDERGKDLFMKGATESPLTRGDGMFERISGSQYVASGNLAFTTTAGGPAILFYSGSLFVVFAGMTVLAILGIAIERVAAYATESPFATAVVSVAVANSICQVNQPYLSMVLIVQMMLSCGAIWVGITLLQHIDGRRAAPVSPYPRER